MKQSLPQNYQVKTLNRILSGSNLPTMPAAYQVQQLTRSPIIETRCVEEPERPFKVPFSSDVQEEFGINRKDIAIYNRKCLSGSKKDFVRRNIETVRRSANISKLSGIKSATSFLELPPEEASAGQDNIL